MQMPVELVESHVVIRVQANGLAAGSATIAPATLPAMPAIELATIHPPAVDVAMCMWRSIDSNTSSDSRGSSSSKCLSGQPRAPNRAGGREG